MKQRRVVVTGLGLISCLGHDPETVWKRVLAGESGIDWLTLFDASEFPTKFAGEVRDFDITQYGESEADWQYCGRNIRFAVAAAKNALADSGIDSIPNLNRDRVGVYLGAGEGRQDFINFVTIIGRSYNSATDHLDAARFIELGWKHLNGRRESEQEPGMSAAHLAKRFHLYGPNMNCLTACAASSQAVGEATETIRRGEADIMISGGTHSMLHPFGITGFNCLGALSTSPDPKTASKPFDRDRNGFVISEGSAIVVLEELEHAKRRGAKIYGEITGYGTTADAWRVTDEHPDARGAISCMRNALLDAGLGADDIQYVNAHGTSTQVNDRVETHACKAIFGEKAYKIPVSSTKSMLGHSIAATGATEVMLCLLALRDQVMPPTINYTTPDAECDLDYVPNQAREGRLSNVVSNSFGFGGQNICLVISKFTG